MQYPHHKQYFHVDDDLIPVSAIGIKKMLTAGQLTPTDVVHCSVDNELYMARAVAEFRAPKFLMTVATDPFVPSDINETWTAATMNGLPENFLTEDYE